MTITKISSQKTCYTYGHGPLKILVKCSSRILRVIDVGAEHHGRRHPHVFPAAPVMGRRPLTPGHPGVRVRNVCTKSAPKSYVMLFSYSMTSAELTRARLQ